MCLADKMLSGEQAPGTASTPFVQELIKGAQDLLLGTWPPHKKPAIWRNG